MKWNSVVAQGVLIMSTIPYPDVSERYTKAGWQDKLRAAVAEAVKCKIDGSIGTYCSCAPKSALLHVSLHCISTHGYFQCSFSVACLQHGRVDRPSCACVCLKAVEHCDCE